MQVKLINIIRLSIISASIIITLICCKHLRRSSFFKASCNINRGRSMSARGNSTDLCVIEMNSTSSFPKLSVEELGLDKKCKEGRAGSDCYQQNGQSFTRFIVSYGLLLYYSERCNCILHTVSDRIFQIPRNSWEILSALNLLLVPSSLRYCTSLSTMFILLMAGMHAVV
ncbi:hypothetical protein WUBG_16460, partial [Wuchereria bancrofti]